MTALHQASELLFREAALLDLRQWDQWLALFAPDAEYWVPSWKNEDQPTSDPKRELSLIYYASRAGLEDRVGRVQSGRAVSSMVLPRTQHAISNVRILAAGPDSMTVASNWTTHQFLPKDKSVELFFGRYRHEFRRHGDDWLIARRKALLLNDYLPARLDFYSL
ncbi:aromatic-ring-hydroxylating dioxygenase subunit beta [Lacisediminimonas sp.]|uniref:aromatic-ring-hydroxylating dioxygenase subunit beta n=1 Tax=Lacisediminimonas sp. TaxID=3060582 RepID=UPI00271E8565|nr:aromatic-ring-hydroxylating dioxygenase subunit beta [Lacisediminimonas sp.]MDO8299675.1 aromatic-ring-hydroxylating dioxygenase subunit beta [Lacisediminimonas sp.]MDO9218459.1 aromatic-ring-hydroxylating dioxygenase subunit beta [Lacisediminimonas sp.]